MTAPMSPYEPPDVPDFTLYIGMGTVGRLNQLACVQMNIAILHFEIAQLEADEIRGKKAALEASKESSASARDQSAFISTAESKAVIIELRAKQAALIEEKWFLARLIDLVDMREGK